MVPEQQELYLGLNLNDSQAPSHLGNTLKICAIGNTVFTYGVYPKYEEY